MLGRSSLGDASVKQGQIAAIFVEPLGQVITHIPRPTNNEDLFGHTIGFQINNLTRLILRFAIFSFINYCTSRKGNPDKIDPDLYFLYEQKAAYYRDFTLAGAQG